MKLCLNDEVERFDEFFPSCSGIKYPKTIVEDVDWLLESDSVTSILGNDFNKSKNLVDDVNSYYQINYGGKIYRKEIGIILLSRRSIQTSIAHGLGKKKELPSEQSPRYWKKAGFSKLILIIKAGAMNQSLLLHL